MRHHKPPAKGKGGDCDGKRASWESIHLYPWSIAYRYHHKRVSPLMEPWMGVYHEHLRSFEARPHASSHLQHSYIIYCSYRSGHSLLVSEYTVVESMRDWSGPIQCKNDMWARANISREIYHYCRNKEPPMTSTYHVIEGLSQNPKYKI